MGRKMRILVVTKESRIEWDRRTSKDGLKAEKKRYSSEFRRILASHEHQILLRRELKSALKDADFISVAELGKSVKRIGKKYDIVISLGGDLTFTTVSHFVGSIPILGMNSDPRRSVGALCSWKSDDIPHFVKRIKNKDYLTERWTMLSAKIDGKEIEPAIGEYFIGERERINMSKGIIVYRGKRYRQKSSGIIVSTGSGSTGWYNAASMGKPLIKPFGATARKAAFIVTEPYGNGNNTAAHLVGELGEGEKLKIISLNGRAGSVYADYHTRYEFKFGSKAVIGIGKKRLNVIVPGD